MHGRAWLVALAAVSAMAWNAASAGQSHERLPAPGKGVSFEDFVGARQCAECHEAQFSAWQASTHGRAGGRPASTEFVGDFDGVVLRFADATVTLEVTASRRYFYHVDQEGAPRQSFEVAGFVGGGHMLGGGTQASFSSYSDGSWRLLPFDYSKHSDVWFCDVRGGGWLPVTPALPISSCRFWPPQSNFASNCGNCHSSQMQANFDAASQAEQLRFMSLAINCESCHGPGLRHVTLMQGEDREALTDIGMQPLELLDKQDSVDVCFRCHAKTEPLALNYLPGKPLREHYALSSYELNPRHADGRSNGWSYQEGHLYSDCFLSGSMTCVDCHDPHSQEYRDSNGVPLPGKLDDGQCVSCHPAKSVEVSKHTGHPANSSGSRCVACHMPFLQQGAVGKAVRFARSDHTIPVPRPAFDASLGLETACAACHADRSVAWQQAQVDRWHGTTKPHKPVIATLLQLEREGDRDSASKALAADFAGHPPAQLDLLRRIASLLHLHEGPLSELQIGQLNKIARSEAEDAAALALALLQVAGASDARDSDLPLATARRLAAWLFRLANDYRRQARLEPAADALQLCREFDSGHRGCHLQAASIAMQLERPGEALNILGDAVATRVVTRREYLDIMDQICAALEDLQREGMQRSAAMERVCSPALRLPAVPLSSPGNSRR